jgi:hypothetical protein
MANRRAVAIAGAVAAVVALLAIPVTRRLIGYALIALIVMAGCEVTVGSYTKRHCDAFTQAWETEDRSIG